MSEDLVWLLKHRRRLPSFRLARDYGGGNGAGRTRNDGWGGGASAGRRTHQRWPSRYAWGRRSAAGAIPLAL